MKWNEPHRLQKGEIEEVNELLKNGKIHKEYVLLRIYNRSKNNQIRHTCIQLIDALGDDGHVMNKKAVYNAYGDLEMWWLLNEENMLTDGAVWGHQLLNVLQLYIWE